MVALAACSNDSLVDPSAVDNRDTQPIGFAVKSANSSRANVGLQTVHPDFGVWGYKAAEFNTNGLVIKAGEANSIDYDTNTIMQQYLVGYTGTDIANHYTAPTAPSNTQESKWYYESYTKTLDNNDVYNQAVNSLPQYLKYWDYSWANSYFFAYSPYEYGEDHYAYVDFNTTDFTLDYKHHVWASAEDYADWMYGAKAVAKADYNKDVQIVFNRMMTLVDIAVYNAIPGYDVVMENISFSTSKIVDSGTSTLNPTGVNYGFSAASGDINYYANAPAIVMMPAKKESGKITKNEDGFTIGGIPSVKFATDMSGTLSWKNFVAKNTYGFFSNALVDPTYKKAVEVIGTTAATASESPTRYKMVPNSTTTDGKAYTAISGAVKSAFQVVMNFKLIAKDTKEVIHVKNARAYVPEDYTNWAPNYLYKYIFKITKNTSGTTDGGDPDPDPEPTPDPDPDKPALYPIIFNSLQVADPNTGEISKEFVVTGDPVDPEK